MTFSPDPSLIPIAADLSGRGVRSRLAQRPRSGAVGGLDGFSRTRIISAAGSGSRHPPYPSFSHPARGYALVSTPRTGFVSPSRPGGQHR